MPKVDRYRIEIYKNETISYYRDILKQGAHNTCKVSEYQPLHKVNK